LGHPDTVADGIAESISIDYSKYCLDKFSVVLHHNVDKILIIGGLCEVDYGRGELKKPIKLILNGRMSKCFGNKKIDIEEIQITSAKKYLQKVLPQLDIDKWLKIHSFVSSNSRIPFWFSPRSLDDLPDFKNPHANDTSTMVGFWPLSTTEKLVLEAERFFYNSNLIPRFNFVEQDIKIMAVRKYKNLVLIICIPFFAKKIQSHSIYEEKLKFIKEELLNYLKNKFGDSLNIELWLNTQDQKVKDKTTAKGHYFVVTGSALDYGEEGVAGRGNRAWGFTSSTRPYSIESIHGKNPVYHVGKIYSYIANNIAKEIATQLECEATVIITTRNGDPLYSPYSIVVDTSKKRGRKEIQQIISKKLENRNWTREIIINEIFLPINDLNYER